MRKATIPKSLKEREEVIRGERGLGEDWSLLGHIIRLYNEEEYTLEQTATDAGVAVSTLVGWLRSCGYEVERRIVPVQPVQLVETGVER